MKANALIPAGSDIVDGFWFQHSDHLGGEVILRSFKWRLWGRQADVTEQARVKPREFAHASAVPSLMFQQHPNGLQSAHGTEARRL